MIEKDIMYIHKNYHLDQKDHNLIKLILRENESTLKNKKW